MKTRTPKNQNWIAVILLLICSAMTAQSDDYTDIQGAWATTYTDANGVECRVVAIVMDGFIAETEYQLNDGSVHWTVGGSWTLDDGKFNLEYEFVSNDTSAVGTTMTLVYTLREDTIRFQGDSRLWTRLDMGSASPLAGAWEITSRMRNGDMQKRNPGPRKTMKILSDTRFQWIAFNSETKEFRGTGGGTYRFDNGVYTEEIAFFSRDNSRVGSSLSFNYEVIDGGWHHKGKSSKGDPIYEIWSPRELMK